MIGQEIRQYRILEKLGAGGMGEVYLAEDTILGRRVALKLLPAEHTRDPERLRRFRLEAKAASALNHPNILTVHELGEADGRQFIATEFVEGETLRTILSRDRQMTAAQSIDLAVQTASALAAAHDAGIVHRDLKPENIMIRRDGYVKVLDFGLAKLTESETAENVQSGAITAAPPLRTEAGVLLGTAPYLSPEQAAGRKVDGRSDIFSFGAVLYEMVSGQRPSAASRPWKPSPPSSIASPRRSRRALGQSSRTSFSGVFARIRRAVFRLPPISGPPWRMFAVGAERPGVETVCPPSSPCCCCWPPAFSHGSTGASATRPPRFARMF
jgi:serine/threonine protein kinase